MPLIDERSRAGAEPVPAAIAEEPRETARRTLAMRIAHRNRLRELRAERLARLRPAGAAAAPAAEPAAEPTAEPAEDAAAALEEFLRALAGGLAAGEAAAAPASGAVLHFQRPAPVSAPVTGAAPVAADPAPHPTPDPAPAAAAAAPACDLDRLPGAGPGLVWSLRRAGLGCLADLAPLAAPDLAARLGPLGRLVPAEAWIARARAAAAAAPEA